MTQRCSYDCRFPSAGLDDARFDLDPNQVQAGLIDINFRDHRDDEDYWGLWKVRAVEMHAGKPVLVLAYA